MAQHRPEPSETGLAGKVAEMVTGRLLRDLTPFDRAFRLIAARRNVYVCVLACGFCQVPSRKVTQSSAGGPLLVLPFILCVPSGSVIPADDRLLIRELEEGDNIADTRLARAIISFPITASGFSTRSEALTAQ